MTNKRLPVEEQFDSKSYLLEMPRSHANAFEKCTAKTISQS